jgi:hypothetical protein
MVDLDAHPDIAHLVAQFQNCLSEYLVVAVELWFGNAEPTPIHNDAAIYLHAGQGVPLQFWLLLDAVSLDSDRIEVTTAKNALECLLPIAPGLMFPGMRDVHTHEGLTSYEPTHVVGGDALETGDLLVFTNGVLHRAPGNGDVFRAALSFRALRKDELRPEDPDQIAWFLDTLDRDARLNEQLVGENNPYFAMVRKRWEHLAGKPFSREKLRKIDRNAHDDVRRRLREAQF